MLAIAGAVLLSLCTYFFLCNLKAFRKQTHAKTAGWNQTAGRVVGKRCVYTVDRSQYALAIRDILTFGADTSDKQIELLVLYNPDEPSEAIILKGGYIVKLILNVLLMLVGIIVTLAYFYFTSRD